MSLRFVALTASLLVLSVAGGQANAQGIGQSGTSGGLGSSGIGSGFGTSGVGSREFGTTSPIGESSGFANENRFTVDASAGEAFVGRDSQDVQTFFSANGAGGQSFLQALGLQQRTDRPTTGRGSQMPAVRITLRVGFETPAINPITAGQILQTRLGKTLKNRLINPQVTVNGRTTILMGQVGSAHEKLLAEKLVLLEPGVSRVENRLVVTAVQPN